MEDNFDMDAALSDISSDLGFAEEAPTEEPSLEAAEPTPPEETGGEAASALGASATPPELPPVPKSWRKEAGEHWDSLPQQVREEVLKREEDILKGIEEYKSRAAFGERMGSAVAPYQQYFQQSGMQPEAAFQQLMNAHLFLSQGTAEQKAMAMQKLAEQYGIDMAQVIATHPEVNQEVVQLRQMLASLGGQVNSLSQERQRQAFEANLKAVTEFSSSAEHPHFEEVADEMSALIKSGMAKDLQDAYDKAIWQNAAVREKVIAAKSAEAEAKRQAEAKERAEAARRASAAAVRSSEKSGRPTAALGSIDDTLAETFREIQSRAA